MIVGLFDRIPELNPLLFPKPLEVIGLLAQGANQLEHLRIIDVLAEICPEQRQKAARPKLPINHERTYIRIKEHVTQQIFLWALQPSREKTRQFAIP